MSSKSSSTGIEGPFAALRTSDGSRGSVTQSGPLVRKADMAYNHVRFAVRPGVCRVSMRKMNVLCNYLKIQTPPKIQAHSYRIELSTKGRNGYETVIKREKAEPLFWSLYQHHRSIFPASLNRLVFDGVSTIYSLDTLKIREGRLDLTFPVSPNRGTARGGRPASMARASIMILPMLQIDDYFSMDESIRTSMVQLLDLVISQEMRCPIVANASRFVVNGRSLFKVPTTDREKKLCVRPIGMGEEVWNGLHMAVKADAPEQLFLNINTSTSIFYTAKLRLVEFYAQVIHGYTLYDDLDCDRLMIDPRNILKMEEILRGTKVSVLVAGGEYKTKKFECINHCPATQLLFTFEDRDRKGERREMSVAEYYAQIKGIRLQFPNLPCLQFTNKKTGSPANFPLEVCTTSEEPRKFKGKLSEAQLNTFIKAAGMCPRTKQDLINTLTATNGSYLGEGELMREWGVEVDRQMVEIKDASILLYPNIQWKDQITRVNEITAEYSIAEEDKKPRKMIETGSKPLAVVMVFVDGDGCAHRLDPHASLSKPEFDAAQRGVYDRVYRANTEFFATTLRTFGLEVIGPAWTFRHLLTERGEMDLRTTKELIEYYVKEIETMSAAQKKDFLPLFVFVFPRRNEKFYSCLKYKCDVEYGVLSQVVLARTFKKLTGHPVSNSTGQNLLLKVLAKVGAVACRIDGTQYRNVTRITDPASPTLVLGIDVSHPSREERLRALNNAGAGADHARSANRARGRHEQLPTSRIAASTAFRGISAHDCPRSVVAVVGNVDLNQTKWGVCSRVQRLGQEETVNLTEPFVNRIKEFHSKTGTLPAHIVIYRDGVGGSQFKKTLYEETQAMELALEKLSIPKEAVKITYIVAQKRHNTRFFASDPQQALDKEGKPGGNTPPGLLIETEITSRTTFDFFLQSHFGSIGTAVPTHYTVLRDDWQPSASFWQTIIFAHCFGNARCPRPLSTPVPLHYAHLAAKRAKQHFDHYKEIAAPEEYRRSREELVREELEILAITPNEKLRAIDSMFFA